MHSVIAFVVGVFAGGAASYLYAAKVIAKVKAEAASAAAAVKKAI
jgi:hypothetical protein